MERRSDERAPDLALLAAVAIGQLVPDERPLAQLWAQACAAPHEAPWRGAGRAELPAELVARLEAQVAGGAAAAEVRRAAELRLALRPWLDERYPAALRDLVGPPPLLWVRGHGPLPEVATAVTVVGARSSTARGRAFAFELGRAIAERGGTVVSGLAIGIDQAALEGALAAGGVACAVLGCGLDRIYPPGAEPLAGRIEERGTIVSEMAVGTPPYKNHFPRRNRILAALGRATLVVEADLQSGSLITAHRALELGRGVHAVPGAIDAATSRGTNRLIRDGAHPLLEIGDLDLVLPGSKRAADDQRAPLLDRLSRAMTAEELARRAGLSLDKTRLRLVELEAEGRVSPLGGGLWQRRD